MLRKHITSSLIFPLVRTLTKRKFWKYYKESLDTQWLSKEEIEKLQFIKLKKLIKHAYDNVPYYNSLFIKNNLHPRDIKTLGDIKKIPITSKKDLQKAGLKNTSAKNFKCFNYYKDSTSGSTGEPFSFLGEIKHRDISTALTIRGYNWAKHKTGEPMISLWGRHEENIPTKIYKFFLNQKTISAFDIEGNFQKSILTIQKFKPKLLVAYASAIVQFGRLCQENKIKDLKIPSIITSAETLYYEDKKMLENVFSAKVFNRYGSRELGQIAHECEQSKGLHVSDEYMIINFEKFNDSQDLKKIIITHLDKYAMPLIRYETGDLGVPSNSKCACGRNLTLIEKVSGRTTDFLKLSTGKSVSFLYFNYVFEQFGPYIKNFQIIQKNWDNMTIKIVPTKKYTNSKGVELINKLSEELTGINLTIEKTDAIPLNKAGKKITVISEIK